MSRIKKVMVVLDDNDSELVDIVDLGREEYEDFIELMQGVVLAYSVLKRRSETSSNKNTIQ